MITLNSGDTLSGVATSATTVTYTIFGDQVATGDTYMVLAQGQFAATAGTIYTSTGVQSLISTVSMVNNGGSSQTVTLYQGGTTAAKAIATFQIPIGGTALYNGERLEIHDATGAILTGLILGSATPQNVTDTATAATAGNASLGAPINHVHYHGALGGGTLHTEASESTDGFLSAADKMKLNNISGSHMTTTQTVSGTQATGTVLTNMSVLLDNPGQAYFIQVDLDANISATSSTAIGVGLNVPTGATLSGSIVGATNVTAVRNTYFTAGASCNQSFVTTSGVTGPVAIRGEVVLGTASSHTGSAQVIANSTGTATIQAGSILAIPIS